MTSFGTQEDYKDGFYIQNTMFPLQTSELHIDQSPMISSFIYEIDNERLFNRDEHKIQAELNPYYISEENRVTLGAELKHPFKPKRLVGHLV
ncbi:hypothetical protein GS926_10850 [Rhodococcus hoagii]|nr:hypothetical protein [Prescottella equi]